MTIDGNQANAILMAVMQGKSLDEIGLPSTQEVQDFYLTTQKQVNEAPQGVTVSPVWDYVDDDKYDSILNSLKPQLDKAMNEWFEAQNKMSDDLEPDEGQPPSQPLR